MTEGELIAPDCKIFVEADLAEAELMGLIASRAFAGPAPMNPRVDLARNPDYDSTRRARFPDGFVYFRYIIDLYMDAPVAEKSALVGDLLDEIWAWGFPAVAACSYENRLPEGGGYRSRNIPWPE